MARDDIVIRRLEVADAEALVHCFERCYEGTYPADAFRDPVDVAALVAGGRLRSVVAAAPTEGVIGHMGLTVRAPDALTAEAGNTVVDPRFRGHHLAARLALELGRLAIETGLVGFQHYPTTAHPVMQKLAVQARGIEVGVLLDYIPAETRYVGFDVPSSAGRVAVVAVYEPLASAPARRVWLPARHREVIAALYERAGLARDLEERADVLPPTDAGLSAHFEERRGLLRIVVESPGADLCERVVSEATRRPGAPVLVDLSLADSAAGAATESLAGAGFFFGAVLPEYGAAGDVLRLQRCAAESPALRLATPDARQLLAYAIADRRRSGTSERV